MQYLFLYKTSIRCSGQIIFVEYLGICYALLANYRNTHLAKKNQ